MPVLSDGTADVHHAKYVSASGERRPDAPRRAPLPRGRRAGGALVAPPCATLVLRARYLRVPEHAAPGRGGGTAAEAGGGADHDSAARAKPPARHGGSAM